MINLVILCLISILLSFILGYFLAKRALKPVSEISDKMKNITANNLNLRLLAYNEKDEFGELASSFNKALDIIENSFDSQKMFVSNVSHELRTPLATLIGEIDYALLKPRSVEEYVATLVNSKSDVTRLIKLVNGLLDFAKASYDESNISMTDVRIDELLIDARDTILKSDSGFTIDLQLVSHIEDDSEITVKGNEYLLKTAFCNLMENNCKFSANKSSTVLVSNSEGKIYINFSDAGIGIPGEEIDEIFTPFFRGKNKQFADGNGIGLALVKKVITMHKANITVEFEPGKGTVFKLEFTSVM